MNRRPLLPAANRGIILVSVLIIGMIITFIAMSFADRVIAQFHNTVANPYRANALLAAEAGVEQTLHFVNVDNTFLGYPDEFEFFNNPEQGRGTFQTTTVAGEGLERIITSTGRVYRYGAGGKLVSTRKIKVTIVGTASGEYPVYTGPGGLILSGSGTITNSKIYVNGYLNMSGSARIGTHSNPLEVNVANKRCPLGNNPGPTYPQICPSGNPITTTGSSRIYGSVCATGQTDASNIFPGDDGAGLMPGCTAPIVGSPTYDRQAHIDRMTITGNPSSSQYRCGGSDVVTWPANLRLEGNVTLTGSCQLTLEGDVYITGDLKVTASTKIRLAESAGDQHATIVTDGSIANSGSSSLLANSQGSGLYFISYESAAPCGPTCTSLSGTDLYNSQKQLTIDITGSSGLAGMTFHSYWGKVKISGSGNLGSAIGQTVEIHGSGSIIFGQTLSSGSTTWSIRSYQQDYE